MSGKLEPWEFDFETPDGEVIQRIFYAARQSTARAYAQAWATRKGFTLL